MKNANAANVEHGRFRGDAVVLTGRVETLYGGTFYEVRLIEGHLAGQTRVMSLRQLSEAGQRKVRDF